MTEARLDSNEKSHQNRSHGDREEAMKDVDYDRISTK
jgi:hypothetical protein